MTNIPAGLRVQRVVTTWTKASRGEPAAHRRNQTPHAFTLADSTVWHDVLMEEATDFAAVHRGWHEWADVPREDLRELGLHASDGRISVLPDLDAMWMPRRHRRPPRVRLMPGESLQWSVNYRMGMDYDWLYTLTTLNVSLDPSDPDVFLGTPTKSVSELASLR